MWSKHLKLADKAFESHETAIDAIITEDGHEKELGGQLGRRQLLLFIFVFNWSNYTLSSFYVLDGKNAILLTLVVVLSGF
jgi:hypothetical protein